MELLRNVALHDRRALIVVTHDARIFGLGDRIAKLDDGHVERIVNSVAELNGNRK
jgi:putative ABC transport system ATP-binding protein